MIIFTDWLPMATVGLTFTVQHAPVVDHHDTRAVAADALGQVASDPPAVVDRMCRRIVPGTPYVTPEN